MKRTDLLLRHLRLAERLLEDGDCNLKPIARKRLKRAADRGMDLEELIARSAWAANHLAPRALNSGEFLTMPGRYRLPRL